MTDLDKLIEAVDAGSIAASDLDPFARAFGVTSAANDAHMAYRGSLDAAKALHDALLPGWVFEVAVRPLGGPAAAVWRPKHKEMFDAIANTPARAWLLAILKAHRSQVQP